MQTRGVERTAQWALVMATVLPTVLALNVPPSPTLLNQCLAIACWGVVVTLIGQLTSVPARAFVVEAWPVVAAVGLLLVCGIGSSLFAFWPASLAWSTLPSMVFAVVVLHAAHRAYRSHPQRIAAWFFTGVLCAGLINSVIGVIQFFWPDAPDGDWIARSGAVGRAVGNLRQPNHLSSWLLWSLVVVAGLLETGRMTRRAAWGAGALLLGATVLTGSRTGIVGVLLLCAWGLFDKGLSTATRRALVITPVVYGLIWWALTIWAHVTGHLFGGETRLTAIASGDDMSSSRLAIWSDTLRLIADQPLLGVGFGEFNAAWSLTAFPTRPTAFFDHAHNIVLQLWAEIGLPMGTAVAALLTLALARAWRGSAACAGHERVDRRVALMLLLMIGLHSMLEYPLWYDYFLLPAAFAFGMALSPGERPAGTHGDRPAAFATSGASGSRDDRRGWRDGVRCPRSGAGLPHGGAHLQPA